MFAFNGKKISFFTERKKKKRKKIPCLSYYNNVTAHEIDNFTEAVLPHMHETSMPNAVRIFWVMKIRLQFVLEPESLVFRSYFFSKLRSYFIVLVWDGKCCITQVGLVCCNNTA